MEALIYFALWAGAIFLMMRFGCGAHVMGHGNSGDKVHDSHAGGDEVPRWIPPEKDKDPVCGKTVPTNTAKPSVYDGFVYYFCSRDCREVFEAAPDLYVVGAAGQGEKRLEESHV